MSALLERERDLQTLRAACGVVAVAGPAGIGKTALLRTLAAESARRVLRADATPLEMDLAWGGAVSLLGAAPEGAADPGSAMAELHRHLVAAAEEDLLVLVDDVQWLDPPTLRWLGYSARRLDGLPVTVVLGLRTGEQASDPAALAGLLARAEVVRPAPLTAAAIGDLARDRFGEVSQRFTAACARATGGNPFLLGELLREMGVRGVEPDEAAIDEIEVESVGRAVLMRLSRLSAPALALAQAVSVLEPHASLPVAAGVAGMAEDEAAALADELASADVLESGGVLRFVHPLVAAAVRPGPARRALLHRDAARRLAAAGASEAVRGTHLLHAPPEGDREVVATLRAAAAQALRAGAPGNAVRLLRRALDEPPPGTDRWAVELELGRATIGVDAAVAHAQLAATAAAAPDLPAEVEATLALTLAALYVGEIGDEPDRLTALAARLRPDERETAVRLLVEAGRVERSRVSSVDALDRAVERVAAAAAPGWPDVVVATGRAYAGLLRGRHAAQQAAVVEAAFGHPELARALRHDPGLADSLAWVAIFAERQDLALPHLERAAADAVGPREAIARSMLSMSLHRAGELDRAEAQARTAIALAEEHGARLVAPYAATALLQVLADRDGEPPPQQGFDDGFARFRDRLALARATLALRCGDPRTALATALEVGESATARGEGTAETPWRATAVEAAARAGERATARALAREELEAARVWGAPAAVGRALRVSALAEDDPVSGLQAAVDALEEAEPVEYARALADLGAALRRDGRRAEARVPLGEALDLAGRIGATRLAAAVRDELVACGGRPRRDALRGPEALTASELRVARLAAAGRSNREIAEELFIGRRTVEVHLSRAYGKLGITARDELADALG